MPANGSSIQKELRLNPWQYLRLPQGRRMSQQKARLIFLCSGFRAMARPVNCRRCSQGEIWCLSRAFKMRIQPLSEKLSRGPDMVQDASNQSSSNSGQQHRGCKGTTVVKAVFAAAKARRKHSVQVWHRGVEGTWQAFEFWCMMDICAKCLHTVVLWSATYCTKKCSLVARFVARGFSDGQLGC